MRCQRITLVCAPAAAVLIGNDVWAAGPDVCAILPVATVNTLIHQNLAGVRSDVSEEAHSDKAVYDKALGTIALFGDVVIDAFVPRGTLSDMQTAAMEKALIFALHSKL